MKNSLKFIGIFALAAIIGFSMIACELEVMPKFLDENPWAFVPGSQGTVVTFTGLVEVDGEMVPGSIRAIDLIAENFYVFSVRDRTTDTTTWRILGANGQPTATVYDDFIDAAEALNVTNTANALIANNAPTNTLRRITFMEDGKDYNFFAVVKPTAVNAANILVSSALTIEEVLPVFSWSLGTAAVAGTASTAPVAAVRSGFVNNYTFVDWWTQLNNFVAEVKKLNPPVLEIEEVAEWLDDVDDFIAEWKEDIDDFIDAIAAHRAARLPVLTEYIEDAARPWNEWIDEHSNVFALATSFADLYTAGGDTITWAGTLAAFPDDVDFSTGTITTVPAPTSISAALWTQIQAWVSTATLRRDSFGNTVPGSTVTWITQLTPPARPTEVADGSGPITMTITPGTPEVPGADRGRNFVGVGNTIVRLHSITAGSNLLNIGEVAAVTTMHIYWTTTNNTIREDEDAWEGGVFNANDTYFVGIGATGWLGFRGLAELDDYSGVQVPGTNLIRALATNLAAPEADENFITINGVVGGENGFRLQIYHTATLP